jgi:molybdopterin converting factor subunit 1
MKNEKTIHIRYYALLREERGLSEEAVKTVAQTPKELYKELSARHHFRLSDDVLKVAVNDAFQDWETPIKDSDTVVFIPPVSGG